MTASRSLHVLIVCVVALALAGCLDSGGVPGSADSKVGTGDGEGAPTDGNTPAGSGSGRVGPAAPSSSGGDANATGPAAGNQTAGNGTVDANQTTQVWPAEAQSTIRPGVQVLVGNSFCTTNFLFKSPYNETYYLGVAAHCVYNDIGAEVFLSSGTPVTAVRGERVGRVVYSSYHELGIPTPPPSDQTHPNDNDFALIKIDESALARTHPSMKYFGGPTGLVQNTGELRTLTSGVPGSLIDHTRILAHGDTPLRPGPDELDRLEGYLTSVSPPWIVRGHFYPYSFQGDSGGGVILDDGRALGLIVSLSSNSEVGITFLDSVMRYAAERGFPVDLVTWEQFHGGQLPI